MFAAQGITAERRVVRLTDGSDHLVHKHQEMVFMNQMIFLSQMGNERGRVKSGKDIAHTACRETC